MNRNSPRTSLRILQSVPDGPRATLRLLLCLLAASPLHARDRASGSLADMSIEELMNESVTSVSKKEQRLSTAAAAIAVLSNDDLRRSGVTSIADALRLVPGMDVGVINASQWAISARGFQGLYANKLLVLVDGRAAYTPLFSGVYWDAQQAVMEDVDRIEVIRGPGATIWGANAVNGVINVVSKSARETQGGYLSSSGGDVHQAQAGLRYGGLVGANTYYRIYGLYQSTDEYPMANGTSGQDNWSTRQGGVRVDSYPDRATHLTGQAEVTRTDFDGDRSDAYNANALGRWTRDLSDRSSIEIQAYYDRTFRNEFSRSRNAIDTSDLSIQQTFGLGERNNVIGGLGYRYARTTASATSPSVQVLNGTIKTQLFSALVQDEFKVVPNCFTLTVGSKLEHDDFTGFQVQPSFRATYTPAENQTWWAAVSRAVRIPSYLERENLFAISKNPIVVGGTLNFITAYGNPNAEAEIVQAYELGYRIQPSKRVSVDLAAFCNRYRQLLDQQLTGRLFPGIGPVPGSGRAEQQFRNTLFGETYGGEVVVTIAPMDDLRLTASYSLLLPQLHGEPSLDAANFERSSPHNQAALRCNYDFIKRASIDASIRYVDSIRLVHAYLTADVRLSYRPTDRLEVALVGQNLFDPQHPEQATPPGPAVPLTEVPRGFYGKLAWRF